MGLPPDTQAEHLSQLTARTVLVIVAACVISVVVACISLVWSNGMAFDPEAWVVWSRELAGYGSLNTQGGPSWKPLPVLFLTIFSLFSHGQIDVDFWLGAARAGSVLGMFGTAAIAYRLGGWTAALITAGVIIVSEWWFYNGFLGNAEPMMLLFLSVAILAQARGWTWLTVISLMLVSMTRVEVWPFALLYAAWRCYLAWRVAHREVWKPIAIAVAAILAVGLSWAVPNIAHSGGSALAAATSAASAGSAKNTAHPFLAVLQDAVDAFSTLPILLAALAAAVLLWHGVRWRAKRESISEALRWELLIGLASVLYILLVAVMTAAGFDGNPRYLVPALGGMAILAGSGGSRVVTFLSDRLGHRIALLRNGLILGVVATVLVVGSEGIATAHVIHGQYDAVKDHETVANIISHEVKELHCPGLAWTFVANRTTLAVAADQSVVQSAHPAQYPQPAGDFVVCAPRSWHAKKDN